MTSKHPLWSKNFILISGLNFTLILTFYLLIIVIVGYAISALGASTAQAGLISGLFIIGTLIGRLFVGKLLLRLGSRTTLIIGLAGFLLLSLFYFLPLNVNGLLGVRFTHGFMMGIASTVLGSTVAQIIPAERRGEGIGYYSLSNTLGTAVGPFLAIWMMLHFGYESIFMVSSVVTFVAFISCFAVTFPQLPAQNQPQKQYNRKIEQYIEPRALSISVIIMLSALCYAGILAFINPFAKTLNLVEAATIYFLVYAITILISRPFTGALMDRKGENVIMYPAFVCMTLGLVVLSQAQHTWSLLLSAVLIGLGFGNLQSICQTLVIKRVPLERIGYATSTFYILLEAGLGLGPYLLGLLLTQMSYQAMYLVSAFVVVLSLLIYFLVHGRYAHAAKTS